MQTFTNFSQSLFPSHKEVAFYFCSVTEPQRTMKPDRTVSLTTVLEKKLKLFSFSSVNNGIIIICRVL